MGGRNEVRVDGHRGKNLPFDTEGLTAEAVEVG